MKRYEVVFFDLDHTLWDFEKNSAEALEELYNNLDLERRVGVKADVFISHYKTINYTYWEAYRKGEISKEDLRIKRFSHAFGDFGFHDLETHEQFGNGYVELSPQKTNLFPNALEVLSYLNEKYPMYIITNGFEEIQNQKLKNSGIDRFFKSVITSEIAGVKKPFPEIYQYAMGIANTIAPYSIMIGDEPSVDLKGAYDLGIDQVYFNSENKPYEQWITYSISDLKELRLIL